MVLSFHPNIVADRNILCAGRLPNEEDRAAICAAKAVILPQGPSETLYRMCRMHCPNVFPNWDARFDFPGKLGQAMLFQKTGTPFPLTYISDNISAFRAEHGETNPIGYPCIFKSNWGGEGDEVFFVDLPEKLTQLLLRAETLEKQGQRGFLLQAFVPHSGRILRVVVIGKCLRSYWKQPTDDSNVVTCIKTGAVIDHTSEPEMQESGKKAVADFCAKTAINLAGFDLLFPTKESPPTPLFLEINYFFGRRGLGGSEGYYVLLEKAVSEWLHEIGLSL